MQSTSKSSLRGGHRGESYDRVIPALYKGDLLDSKIGIWPRNKSSDEIYLLLTRGFQALAKPGEGQYFPESMRKIIHQFMVANKYVGAGRHLRDKKELQRSLMVRLDLQHNTTNTRDRSRFDGCKCDIFTYIMKQTLRWKEKGIIIHWADITFPVFHPCVERWTHRDWNGKMPEDFAHTFGVPHLTENMLTTLAGSLRLAHERQQKANKAALTQGMQNLANASRSGTGSSSKSVPTEVPQSSSELVSAFLRDACSSVPTSPQASKDSDIIRSPLSQGAHRPPEEKGPSFTVRGYADSYLSDHYDIDDDLRVNEDRLRTNYQDKQGRDGLNGEHPPWKNLPFVTTHHGIGDQYVMPQTREPSCMQSVDYSSHGWSAQRVLQDSNTFEHVQRAQTVAPSYQSRSLPLDSRRPTSQSHKRSVDSYNERPEPKRNCPVILSATKPFHVNDLANAKANMDKIRALQRIGHTDNRNSLQRLDSTDLDGILRTSDPTFENNSLQPPTESNHGQLSQLPNNQLQDPTLETQLSFSNLLSTLSLAHSILAGFAPTSLSEFSTLSREWDPSKGKASCLSEVLFKCKDHMSAMGKYIENAIELLEISFQQHEEGEVV